MSRTTYINLPVKDVPRTIEFFEKLGFGFDEAFTDDNSACLILGADTYGMLHAVPVFQAFTAQQVADTSATREVLVGLSARSRDEVDELVDRAVAAGGVDLGGGDQGFMYMRGFLDPDGHQWSFLYLEQ